MYPADQPLSRVVVVIILARLASLTCSRMKAGSHTCIDALARGRVNEGERERAGSGRVAHDGVRGAEQVPVELGDVLG